jgi:simple sugar transport system substrate-binding protein
MRSKLAVVLALMLVLFNVASVMAQDEFVFGVVLVGGHDDNGWSQAHYEGGLYAEGNIPNARMVWFENLNPVGAPEATLLSVVTEMVDEGAQIIFTTSADFEQDTNTVAEAFPDIKFINITGSNVLDEEDPAPVNVGNFNGQMEVTESIAGCAAALASDAGKIGYVGALIDPETRRLASSAYLGARHCWENYKGMDPADLTFEILWVGFWFHLGDGITNNPNELATTFFNGGADVVSSGIDTPEAVQIAQQRSERGEAGFAVGYDSPVACDLGPDVCLGAPFYNWGPSYKDMAERVIAGEWEQTWEWNPPDYSDLYNLDTTSVSWFSGPAMTDEIQAQLDEFIAEVSAYGSDPANADSIFLWEGPLNLQDGTELAAEGEKVALLDIWFLPQLLEGMLGDSVVSE